MDKARSIFRHPNIGNFFQAEPILENPFTSDGFLQRILARLLPTQIHLDVTKDLTRFGERVRNELEPLAVECEQNPPYLVQLDPWGKRVDNVVTCHAWKQMKSISAEEGIVSLGYETDKYGPYSRLYQVAKLFLYSPSSGLYSCPLAMTDGAAKSIKALGIKQLNSVYERLTSRDPAHFWTSGQWMTERKGGSDVGSGTETIAVPAEDGSYRLHGYKWFSSATDSDMSLTLARIGSIDGGDVQPGSSGLSMFYLETHKPDGTLNNIQVMRLKNKLGTRQVPTGELLLDGTVAHLVSPPGRGVASISHMLTITRIHNAVSSVAAMRRVLSLARDYSKRRSCFGLEIAKYPLHVNTLAGMEMETRAGMVLLFEVTRLLGLIEAGKANENEQHLFRLLTPVLKLYTAKQCVSTISEGLECFGGQGYIEDTGLPRHFRDAQVTPIWEGTTNILSLDVLRAIGKSKGDALQAFHANLKTRLEKVSTHSQLSNASNKVSAELEQLVHVIGKTMVQTTAARILAFSIAEVTIGTLLLEHAASQQANKTDLTAALRWTRNLASVETKIANLGTQEDEESCGLVFDSYNG